MLSPRPPRLGRLILSFLTFTGITVSEMPQVNRHRHPFLPIPGKNQKQNKQFCHHGLWPLLFGGNPEETVIGQAVKTIPKCRLPHSFCNCPADLVPQNRGFTASQKLLALAVEPRAHILQTASCVSTALPQTRVVFSASELLCFNWNENATEESVNVAFRRAGKKKKNLGISSPLPVPTTLCCPSPQSLSFTENQDALA